MVSTDSIPRGSGTTAQRLYKEVRMKSSPTRRVLTATAAVAALAIPLAACSGGGGGSDTGGKTEITYLSQNDELNTSQAKALIEAFEKKNPDITVKLDTQPA